MTIEDVTRIVRDGVFCVIKSSAPILLVSLIIGLAVSIFQTITSIQEQTLTFVPKVLGVFLVLMLAGNWILNNIIVYMTDLWGSFALYIR